jgi:hypothetical protein
MKTNKFIAVAAIAAAGLFTTAALADTPSAPSANEVVYVPQLPSASELTKAASAQGVTVERIDQTSSQITVTYKYSNGQVNTVAYQPLASADSNTVPTPTTAAPAVAVAAPATVVYTTPGYYYDPYPYYGWGWYPPVALRVGVGFGFHGGGRWR